MSTQILYNCYSVDTSVMIALKDMGPLDIFQPVWDEISRLVSTDRWKLFETVAGELSDPQLEHWVSTNPQAISKFDLEINAYLTRFMSECAANNMTIINPHNTKNDADPFVIMLALYLERRHLSDLRVKTNDTTCCVLTNELPREHKVNIPFVCDY